MPLISYNKSWPEGCRRVLKLPKPARFITITTLLILFNILPAVAAGGQQNISLSVTNAPLEKVFKEIQKQSGYTFVYTRELLHQTAPVTIKVSNARIDEALTLCVKDQPITFTVVDKMVIIKPKLNDKASAPKGSQQSVAEDPIDISGRVTDDEGNPLAGANVKIKGSNIGTTTDKNGQFKMSNVDPNAVLEITFVGHEQQTVVVRGKSVFNISLGQKLSLLDETVVIAYGTTTRRFATGNIASVKASDIEKQPVNNPLLALEGRVPGLFVSQANGLPGSGINVRIQGQNSIIRGSDPLYVIDGVPYLSQMLPTTYDGPLGASSAGLFGGSYGNPLSYINTSDIESIEILKDADATAIYGSRAASGAILITTKKGKVGQIKTKINLQHGWGQITRKLDLLNTEQYLEMRKEAKRNDNASVVSTDYDINGLWDSTRYTDWQKVLLGNKAQYSNINVNVSGGTAISQYFLGGTWHRETTVFPGNFSDEKGSLHFNLNSSSSNQRFRFQLSASYSADNNRLPTTDLTGIAIILAPNAPNLYNEDGSLNWMPNSAGNSSWTNPIARSYNTYQLKSNNLLGNISLAYQILPGLQVKSSLGYTNLQTNEVATNPLSAMRPENRLNGTRFAYYTNGLASSWIIEPQVTYKRMFGKGTIDCLVGLTFQQNTSNGQNLLGTSYNSDKSLKDIRSAANVTINSTIAAVYKYNALFTRINYNWNNKYVVNLTARRDGSSRFGAENQFHDFGSVGCAWIFTQENLIKRNISFLSFGKISGSFGTTGNDQIGDYQFMNLYSPINVSVPYQNVSSIGTNSLPNPYLQWEETRKLQVGIDLGILSDRILLNSTFARNRSSNQLLSYSLPPFVGFGGITKNFPATVQNTSWEFSLNTTNVKSKNFLWSTSLNLTIPKNKLLSFPNLAESSYSSSLIIGQPVSTTSFLKVFHFLGVDPISGIYQFEDKNGNPTSVPNYSTDNKTFVNTLPKFYGGAQNQFRYKWFQLDIMWQFVKQIGANYLFGAFVPGRNVNQPTSVLDRWQKPGDISTIQKYNSNSNLGDQYSYAISSDAAYSDASYLRLKTLSVSWLCSEHWMQKLHLQNCQIYLQCQNVITITNFIGMDPENQNVNSLPPLRMITAGIQVGF